jgi:DNA-binding transcriptional MerR regulator
MKIGELAQQLGVSRSIIRYYEVKGLLPRVNRDSAGYRCYDEADLERLELVTGARQLGISCPDIRRILAVHDAEEMLPLRFLELLQEKAIEAEKRIKRLRSIRLELRQMRDRALTLSGADKA